MNIQWRKAGIKELAAIISAHLRMNGIDVVLVGGACVSIYSDNEYMSYDIDLVTDCMSFALMAQTCLKTNLQFAFGLGHYFG